MQGSSATVTENKNSAQQSFPSFQKTHTQNWSYGHTPSKASSVQFLSFSRPEIPCVQLPAMDSAIDTIIIELFKMIYVYFSYFLQKKKKFRTAFSEKQWQYNNWP